MTWKPDLFWKNFRLGTELHVAGSFIYNGIYAFDQMEHFYFEEEMFEFLYNIAVGIERLEKVTLILLEHSPDMPQQEYEKSLITHDHLELLKRIKTKQALNLGKTHIKFLNLLSVFYRSIRYGRYNLSSVYDPDESQKSFIDFMSDSFKMEIKAEFFDVTPNDEKIKRYIGNLIGKVALQLYEVIWEQASHLNIYSYEIRSESKAYKIFVAKQFTFEPERYLQKELLVHLINGDLDKGFLGFVKSIPPLPFEEYQTNYYVNFILNFHKHINLQGEIDAIAEDRPLKISRINKVKLIGSDINFETEEEGFLK